MSPLVIHLMLGPLMLGLAFIYQRFPPKKINHLYGYRTPRSMRSQEAWDCANQFCIKAFFIVSGLTCMAQVVTYLLMASEQAILWSSGVLVVGLIAVIPLTELHLKKKGFN